MKKLFNHRNSNMLILSMVAIIASGCASPAAPVPTATPTPTTSISQKCNSPTNQAFLTISPAKQAGLCDLILLVDTVPEYTFSYPDRWNVKVVGANESNLLFTDTQSHEVFVQIFWSGLELKDAYKSVSRYEQDESPVIDPNEKILSKTIETIGDKQVLSVITEQNTIKTHRYFIVSKNHPDRPRTYVFKFPDDKNLQESVKQILTSMHF